MWGRVGVPFTRHVKKGKPCKKFIVLDASCVKLLWKDTERKRLEGFILLDDIIATKRGQVQKKAGKGTEGSPLLPLGLVDIHSPRACPPPTF